MITRPVITLISSILSLFSSPLLMVSVSLGCQHLEDNPLRYLLITFFFLIFLPQLQMYYLCIYTSPCYRKHWQSTSVSRWITAPRQQRLLANITSLSTITEQKGENLSLIPTKTWNAALLYRYPTATFLIFSIVPASELNEGYLNSSEIAADTLVSNLKDEFSRKDCFNLNVYFTKVSTFRNLTFKIIKVPTEEIFLNELRFQVWHVYMHYSNPQTKQL